jgi:hypothetical protein
VPGVTFSHSFYVRAKHAELFDDSSKLDAALQLDRNNLSLEYRSAVEQSRNFLFSAGMFAVGVNLETVKVKHPNNRPGDVVYDAMKGSPEPVPVKSE